MIHIYSLLLLALILTTLPYWVWRYFTTPKYQGTVLERLGLGIHQRDDRPRIWIHAVSVGETLAAQGLVQALKQSHPDHELVFSTVTKTGRQIAKDKLTGLSLLFHLPIDLPWVTQHVMSRIRPTLIIIMETELWPGFLTTAKKWNIPIVIVNGRLSPGSFNNYQKARYFMRFFLDPVHLFLMQSELDAKRMEAIGAPGQRIRVTGNIKYDQALVRPSQTAMATLSHTIGQPVDPILLAASTHPGEEKTILRVYEMLKKNHSTLRLILAPRHPERASQVATLIQNHGFSVQTISQSQGQWDDGVLLVDSVGWLTRLYGIARLVYVGGSLIPHGGQNMLEPAAWGLPPTFGPHTFNFKDIVRQLLEAEAAFQVENEGDLYRVFSQLLQEPDTSTRMGQAARQVVETNAGALLRTLKEINTLLGGQGHAPTSPPA